MKQFYSLIFLVFFSVTAFPQENICNNALGMDIFPLGKGLVYTDPSVNTGLLAAAFSYERIMFPWSAGASLDLYYGKSSGTDLFYLSIMVHGRCYIFNDAEKPFFFDVGMGFNSFLVGGQFEFGGFNGFTISLKAGYKIVIKRFFIEPSMSFVYSKSGSVAVVPLGWQPGLIAGIMF